MTWTIERVRTQQYQARRYGLFRARRRLTRMYFQHTNDPTPAQPGKSYAPLVEEAYARLIADHDPFIPVPLPNKIRVTWDTGERAFTIHGDGFKGFYVTVLLKAEQDSPTDDAQAPHSHETAVEVPI